MVARHIGRRKESAVERVDNRGLCDPRGGREQFVEVRITPLTAALLDQPPTGDVPEEPHPAERAQLVAETGRERSVRGVGRGPFVPHEQPGAGGHEGRACGCAGQHRRRGVVSAHQVHRNTAPLPYHRSGGLQRREP